MDSVVCLLGIVDEREVEFVPSEKNAESDEVAVVVDGGAWLWEIATGDFDDDECVLLGRRRGMTRFIDED